MRLPGDDAVPQEAEHQVQHDDGHDPSAVQAQTPGHHEPGAEQAEDRAGGAERLHVRRGDEVEHHRAPERADQVHGQIAHAAEQLLQRRANQDQRPHVEQDVQRAVSVQAGRSKERRGDQTVVLALGNALQRPAVDRGLPEHRHVVAEAGVDQLDQVEQDVDPDQRPGDRRARAWPPAEHRARPADAAVSLPHAVDALLADRRGAQAVRARGPAAPDAGDVGFPARVPEAGRDARARAGVRVRGGGHGPTLLIPRRRLRGARSRPTRGQHPERGGHCVPSAPC